MPQTLNHTEAAAEEPPPTMRGFQILRVSTVGRRHRELLEIATQAESAGYDALLIGDDGDRGADPIAVACALAPKTKQIGLIPAVDTARQHPFGLARRLTGLDQVSHGRAGWAPQDSSVGRLRESVTIANRLWVSWDEDAIQANKEAGIWVDLEKIHIVDFDGEHYSTHAPLDMPRGPQGQLLLVAPAHVAAMVQAPALVLEDHMVVDYVGGAMPAVSSTHVKPGQTLRARAGVEELHA